MSKDSLWFRHDSNAKDDPKCMLLIDALGMEGYGVYWALLEVLREQTDYKYPLILAALARRYNTSEQVIKSVIYDFGLFTVDEENKVFYSESLMRRMETYDSVKASRSMAGKISAEKRRQKATDAEQTEDNQSTQVEQVLNKCSANVEQMSNGCSTNRIDKNRIELNRIDENRIDNTIVDANASMSAEKNSADPKAADEQQIFPDFLENEASTDDEARANTDIDSSENEEKQQQPNAERNLTPKECQKVADYWNREVDKTGANVSKVAAMSEPRINKLRIRWREFEKVGIPNEVFRTIVRQVVGSKFLQGDNGRGWKCSFDWLIENGKNWVKVYEGNYANQQQDGNSQGAKSSPGDTMTQRRGAAEAALHPNKMWEDMKDMNDPLRDWKPDDENDKKE